MDLVNQAYPIAILIASLFGVLSFLSPCVLPIVPAYLAFMSGTSIAQMREGQARAQLLRSSIFFVFGLSTAFLIMALVANRIGGSFFQNSQILSQISGIVIIIFGLHFLGVFRIGFLQRELRANTSAQEKSMLSSFLLGLAFALGWSPCLGPALSAILALVASQEHLSRGMALMLAYALGMGLPFILSAIFIQRFIGHQSRLNRMLPTIEKIMGALLIIVGIFMFSGAFTEFAFWLNETFPVLEKFG